MPQMIAQTHGDFQFSWERIQLARLLLMLGFTECVVFNCIGVDAASIVQFARYSASFASYFISHSRYFTTIFLAGSLLQATSAHLKGE